MTRSLGVGNPSGRTAAVFVGAAVSVGLALRVWGIGFGLPELFHPDEPAYVLQALAIARGLPDGLTFANPPLYKYLLLGEYAIAFVVDRLTGATSSPQHFVDQFRSDPSRLYLLARLTNAVFGAATCVAAFALGAVVANRRVGLIAGGLSAVTYLLVRDSHFGVNDALVSLLVTCGLIYCARIARGGGRVEYLAAGALTGLAFAAKYHGLVLLVPLVMAHVIRTTRWLGPGSADAQLVGRRVNAGGSSPWRDAIAHGAIAYDATPNLAAAAAACLVAAILAFPSLVTEPGRVWHDVYLHLYVPARAGYDGLDPSVGYQYYLARVLPIGLGWPLLLASLTGLALSVAARRSSSLLVLSSLPVTLIAFLGAQQLYFARFLLPAIPSLMVEAAVAVDALLAIRPLFGLAAYVVIAAPTLVDSIRFDTLLTRQDTRTLARDWVSIHLPADATIAVDAPPIGPSLSPRAFPHLRVANEWSLFDLDALASDVGYVVTSSFSSELRLIDPELDRHRRAFYQETLPTHGEQLARFEPSPPHTPTPAFVYDQIYAPFDSLDRLERPGPTVTVYRLTSGPGRGTPR